MKHIGRFFGVASLPGMVALAVFLGGCKAPPQAMTPQRGTTRTEDVSQVVYNYSWLKKHVYLRDLQVERGEANTLLVTAQLHSTEPHTSRRIYIKTDFYSAPLEEGGVVVDTTEWEPFDLEPRKRVTYRSSSLVAANDFRIYVNYGQDIGRP